MSEEVEINKSARDRNDSMADRNRNMFSGYRVLNLIGSPGAGKTAILERTAEKLGEKLSVIEGDVQTDIDAGRINAHGSQAVQIETGGSCHLNAEMVGDAAGKLDLGTCEVIIIENVGNLVCPSGFDLGEDEKVAVISLPEGDEKPVKYPALFIKVGAVIINKIDLKDVMDYDIDRVKKDCARLNSNVRIFEMSAATGEGLHAWVDYLSKDR